MKPVPPPAEAAYLLDFDGTLVDIAPTPASIVVPPDLPEHLRRLRRLAGDAVAIVTGRPLADVDRFLGDAPFAVAAEHGAVIRHAPGLHEVVPEVAHAPAAWIEEASALTARHPGAMLERKRHGFVLHYRAVPDREEVFRLAMERFVAERPADFVLLPSKMAWELRPAGVDKGRAAASLMASSPFAGRVPVFVGDDRTDEDGMAEAERRGGVGLLVGRDFADPEAVRAWLRGLAEI